MFNSFKYRYLLTLLAVSSSQSTAAIDYGITVSATGNTEIKITPKTLISSEAPANISGHTHPIQPATSVKIVDEKYLRLSPVLPQRWEGETHLKETISGGTSLPGSLVPNSVTIKLEDGTPLEKDIDFVVNEKWGAVARTPNGRITTDSAVLISYEVGQMRLDSVRLTKAGLKQLESKLPLTHEHTTIVKGIPQTATPLPPDLPHDTVEIARIFMPYHATTVEPWQVFNIGEKFKDHDNAPENREKRVPKTLAKLRAGEAVTIVTWGDSVTVGGDSSVPEKAYANLLISQLKSRFPKSTIRTINAGIGGSNTNDRLPNLQKDVLDHKPDLVTIEFVNDMNFPEDTYRKNHISAIEQIQAAGAEVIEITPHFTMPEMMNHQHPRGKETRPAVTWLRQIANQMKIGLADTAKRWEWLENEGTPYITLLKNGINHPDDRGHEMFVNDLMSFFPAVPRNGATNADGLKYRIALLGNPTAYPDYTKERLEALVAAGFNGVQLNIAWLRRPNDEALNLNDVVTAPGDVESTRTAQRRAQLQERNRLAKAAGMRTMFHFGSPFMWRNPETGEIKRQGSEAFNSDPSWFDVQNPKVVAHEVALLKEFRKHFPDVDDILIYTYDQDAWQASEWTQSKLTRGVPLHDRLPKYLSALHTAWMEGRPAEGSDHIMWWEPWELSAGQVYKCLPLLPRKNFGMMLHTNIAEVQITRPIDLWFRNTARMCKTLGIPVVAEAFFGSATEEIEPLSFPTPRLTDEQLKTILTVDGLSGIKEYFGVIPLIGDLNLEIFSARLKAGNEVSTADLLDQITKPFGPQQKQILELLEELSSAIQMYPWDVSWYARLGGTGDIDHGWAAAFIRGQQVETPSWESTRRSLFMMTEDQQPHPFLIEDVHLRMDLAIEHLDNALSISQTLIPQLTEPVTKTIFEKAMVDAEKFKRIAKSYALHLRETNVSMLLRVDLETSQPLTPHLVREMKTLLQQDVENQNGKSRVVEMQKEFETNPEKFVRTRLLPTKEAPRERGVFTLTTR